MIIALISVCLADEPVNAKENEPLPVPNRIEELSLARVDAEGKWGVRDGRARDIDARTWAILTGDVDVLGQIEASRKKGRTLGWGFVIGGGTVALSSMVPLLLMEDALGANEDTPGFDQLGTRNDVKVATAFSLLGTGVILAGTGLAAHAVADKRALDLSLHLEAAEVDASIAAYNARLAETLTVAAVEPVDTGAEDLPEGEDPLEPAAAPTESASPAGAEDGSITPPVAPAPNPAPTAGPAASPTAGPAASSTTSPATAPSGASATEAAPAPAAEPAPAPAAAPAAEPAPAPAAAPAAEPAPAPAAAPAPVEVAPAPASPPAPAPAPAAPAPAEGTKEAPAEAPAAAPASTEPPKP